MLHARILSLSSLAVLAIACSSNAPAVPQAAISVEVIPGSNTSAQCPVGVGDNVWDLGGGAESGAPVRDGDTQSGAGVKVTCSVSGNDSAGYQVTGDVELAGKGSFTILGHVSGDTSQTNQVHAGFVLSGGLGSWADDGCNLTFPRNGGIASGRIWATVDCPTMKDSNRNTQCDGNAEFRLENCNP